MKNACVGVLSIIELKNARWNIEIRPLYITMAELLKLFKNIIATYLQNQTESVNALSGKKEEYSFVKVSVT